MAEDSQAEPDETKRVARPADARITWCGDEYALIHLGSSVNFETVIMALRARELLVKSDLGDVIVDSLPGFARFCFALRPETRL